MSEKKIRIGFWWPAALAAAVVLILAAMSLGSMDAAVSLEFKLTGPEGRPLSLDPGQERPIEVPPKVTSKGGIWEARLVCPSAEGCGELVFKVNGRAFKPVRLERGRVYFTLDLPSDAKAELSLANLFGHRIVLPEVRMQNYRGVNRNVPRFVLFLEDHPGGTPSFIWLVVVLALCAQASAAVLDRRKFKGRLGDWRVWALICPPLILTCAAVGCRLFGLYLTLPWGTFLGLALLGPLSFLGAFVWDPKVRYRFFKWVFTWGVLVLCFVMAATLVYKLERKFTSGPGLVGLLHFGKHFTKDKRFLPDTKFTEKIGYDGQFFFFAAQDPFGRKGAGRNMDSPSYRYQRMLYPLVLNLLSGGDKNLLPYIMAGFNLAVAFGAFLVMYFLAKHMGAAWPWSIFFFFNYGMFKPIFMGLCEPMANFLLALSIYLVVLQRFPWALLSMSAMVLTKEYYVLAPLFGAAVGFLKKLREKWWFVPPVAVVGIWQVYLYFNFGRFAFQESHRNLAMPFKELLHHLLTTPVFKDQIFCVGVLATVALTVWLLWRNPRRWDVWLLAAFLVMPIVGGRAIWESAGSFVRMFSPTYLIYLFVLFKERSPAAAVPGLIFGYHVLHHVKFL